jgi:peptide/nickel transport system substrate-binding protein
MDSVTHQVKPGVAKTWESPDGLTWTFHLDPAATFLKDVPVTAEDVVQSLTGAAKSDSLSAARLETIAGVAEFRAGAAPSISGLSAVDAATVSVTLTRADYGLPELLSSPSYGIAKASGSSIPLGSGPFRIDSTKANSLALVRRDAKASKLARIDVDSFATVEEATAALRKGVVDIAPMAQGAKPPSGFSEVSVDSGTVVVEANTRSARLADQATRVNLLSVVRDAFTTAPIGMSTADSFLPGALSLSPACEATCWSTGPSELSPTLAGTSISVEYLGVDGGAKVAGAIEERLRSAGASPVDVPTAISTAGTTFLDGSGELVVFALVGSELSDGAYLGAAFESNGPENISGVLDPELDAALQAARSIADPAERRAAYEKIERMVLDEGVAVPVVSIGTKFMVRSNVRGVEPLGGVLFDGRAVNISE